MSLKLPGRSLFFLLMMLIGTFTVYAQSNSTQNEIDTQRYLALMLLNLEEKDDPRTIELIKQAKQNGMNAVYLTLPWDKVYLKSPTDVPNWKRFDEQVNLAVSLGMKVALRIHLGRHQTSFKPFWQEKDRQVSNGGQPMLGGYGDTFFGFDNQPIVNKAQAFVTEATTRYKYLQRDKKLLFISVTHTPTQEGEYPSFILENGKDIATVYDYSESMTKGFQSWLKPNYKKIERLNFLWGTYYKSFEEVPMPSYKWDPSQTFRQRFGKDLYIYRHNVLKNFVNQMISTIKSVDPGIRFVADYGSVFDALSPMRGTLGYKSLSEKADGIKVNDDLINHDHRWSVDILKSDSPAHFFIANELFLHSNVDNATHSKQLNENFAHGANLVAVVISTVNSMQKAAPFLQQASAAWLQQPIPTIVYKDEVSYKLSAAVEKSGASNVIYKDWASKAYADPSNPKPVKIRLEEDLFSPKYWDDASNYPPYVFRPIPMQIIAVNKDFSFKLPTDTFSDVDGTIVRMDVSLLPSWLKYEGGLLKGKPTVLADHRILVKGFDDEGASTDAYFTIRVDTRENANKPPIVNVNFSNQSIAINKTFTLTIPKDAFIDPDGEVTKVEVIELPSWLKFSNGVFSGTPAKLGDYRVSLKAYDDLNAFVETYFTLKVVEPQDLNNPPYVVGSFPIKYASVNTPFTYNLPNDIFTDSDGYISSITVLNRPSWLDVALNVLSGTPTEEGEYRLIVRAYDNFGAYAEAPLVLRVEVPRLRFELVKGGSAVNQQIIRSLQHDDVLNLQDMPPLLNIFAYGNFDYDEVEFNLKGPVHISSKTMKFPYALYESKGGFTPFVGRYTLTVTAKNKDASIISNTMQFGISNGDSLYITRGIADWNFFPNPVETVFNIKLPEELPLTDLSYYLINSMGKKMVIPAGFTNIADHLVNIDLRSMQLPSGIYFIQMESEGTLLKQFRMFKK